MSTPAAEAYAASMNQPLIPAPTQIGRVLTHGDRCDQCGAAAYVRTESYYSTLQLLFCAHHYTEHERNGHFIGGITHAILDERPFLRAAVAAQADTTANWAGAKK